MRFDREIVVLWNLIGEMVVLWDLIGEIVILWDLDRRNCGFV